jgi:hypothetical protein
VRKNGRRADELQLAGKQAKIVCLPFVEQRRSVVKVSLFGMVDALFFSNLHRREISIGELFQERLGALDDFLGAVSDRDRHEFLATV